MTHRIFHTSDTPTGQCRPGGETASPAVSPPRSPDLERTSPAHGQTDTVLHRGVGARTIRTLAHGAAEIGRSA